MHGFFSIVYLDAYTIIQFIGRFVRIAGVKFRIVDLVEKVDIGPKWSKIAEKVDFGPK